MEGAGPFPLVNETITGEVHIDYDRGVSFLTARTRESRLRCEGLSRVTYTPPYLGRVQELVCFGTQGIARLQCSDGRVLTGDWRARTCNSGEGTGTDNTGARFSFSFGMTQAEAQQYLASAQAELAQKPRFPGGGASPQTRPPGSTSTGTGFLVSADGLIVTNHHVIEGSTVSEVHRGDSVHRATVIARDAANDLAVLKADVKGQPLRLGSARASVRGDEVLTLGFPLPAAQGQSQKATFGRINALTGIDDDARFLQIDIPIQAGNSGGADHQAWGSDRCRDRVSQSGAVSRTRRRAAERELRGQGGLHLDPCAVARAGVFGGRAATGRPDVVRATEDSVFLIVSKSEAP